jgi:integrase/recombinase XerC
MQIMDIEGFTTHLKSTRRRLSPESAKAYGSDLKLFDRFLESNGLRETQVNATVIADYIRHMETVPNPRFGKLGLSEASIARRVVAVRKYYEYRRASSNPRLKDPTSGLKFAAPTNDDCKAVDDDVIEKLIDGISSLRDRALVLLALSSGLRNSEIHQLNRDAIDVRDDGGDDGESGGTGTVKGKGSKKRSFYIDSDALDALCDYLTTRDDNCPALFTSERRQRMAKRTIQERVAHWCKRLGIEHIHPHQFRHCFANRLANASIDSTVLKELMGHDDLRTTNRYYNLEETTKSRQYYAAMERWRARRN